MKQFSFFVKQEQFEISLLMMKRFLKEKLAYIKQKFLSARHICVDIIEIYLLIDKCIEMNYLKEEVNKIFLQNTNEIKCPDCNYVCSLNITLFRINSFLTLYCTSGS